MDPVAFRLFGIEIMWYGIIISMAMLLSVSLLIYRGKSKGFTSDEILNVVLISIPVGVVGARLYYVIFDWSYYSGRSFLEIINPKGGGLAIYGGLIFGLLAAVIVCLKIKVSVVDLLDLAMPSIAIAQSIGRWGNFINQEAYGRETDLPWAITVNGSQVHPTFLYESLGTFLIFVTLMLVSSKQKFQGQIILLYGILYSVLRFVVEGFRIDSLMLFDLRVSQLVSVIIFLVCSVIYIKLDKGAKSRLFR